MPGPAATLHSTLPARALCVSEDGRPPEWIELIPAGATVQGFDGRRWSNPDPAALIAATREYGRPLVLDWEHATDVRAPRGEDAPAAGWMELDGLEVRDGVVGGRVSWTPRAAEQVVNREYRFVSPMFLHDASGRITRLEGGGLTNTPNLRLRALNREQEPALDLASRLRHQFGLAADAGEDAIFAAATTARAVNVDLTRYAPRADLERATNRVKELEAAQASRDAAELTLKIEDALNKAATDGKIAPASIEEYRAMCKAQGGLEVFQRLVATLPVIASGRATPAAQRPAAAGDNPAALTDEQRAVCRALGQDEAKYAASLKTGA